METDAHAHSVAGRHHANQDRYRILDGRNPLVRASSRGVLYAVADGVGGAPKGMAAAQLFCDRLTDFYRREDIPGTEAGLCALLREINAEIHGWGFMPGTDRPLGAAAVTVAWFRPGRSLTLFHIGDCAALLYDGARALWLTREHGVGRGLDNYMGIGAALRIEQIPVTACDEGDWLCLVTDGVTKVCTPGHVAEALARCPEVRVGAERLVAAARNQRSQDDITALVIEVLDWDNETWRDDPV